MYLRAASQRGARRAAATTPILLAALVALAAAATPTNAHAAAPLYSSASPFNQPIPPAPTLDPKSSTMVQSIVAARAAKGFALAVREWTFPTYFADASTPRYDVAITSRPPGWRWDAAWRPIYETMVNVPIPEHAKPDPMADGNMTVIDPATNCEYDFFAAGSGLGSTTALRPDGVVTSGWPVRSPTTPAPSASDALRDRVTQPAGVPAADYLAASSPAGKVTEVTVASARRTSDTTAGKAWFYANTANTSRLRVDVVWQGAVRATTIVAKGQTSAWRSVSVLPPTQAALDDLRLRFTSLDGGTANVRAAYFALTKSGKSWSANWGNTIRTDSNGIYPDGTSTRASGFSLAGVIWPEELRAGRIDHALVFAYPHTKSGGSVLPATAVGDGLSTRLDAIPIGARVQLDPNLNLDALGLTGYEKTIARALQEYGMILSDSGGALSLYAIHPQSYSSDPYTGVLSSAAYSYLQKIPVERFRVLNTGQQAMRTAPPMVYNGCGEFR